MKLYKFKNIQFGNIQFGKGWFNQMPMDIQQEFYRQFSDWLR